MKYAAPALTAFDVDADEPTAEEWLEILMAASKMLGFYEERRAWEEPGDATYTWITDQMCHFEQQHEQARQHVLAALREPEAR